MSFNICAISGNLVENPVVSRKTGHVFEKRLIDKIIEEVGKCPITGDYLEKSDLIEVKSEMISKPRNVANTSLPGLFNDLQNEWETVLGETYTNKKQLELAKQELAHSLYRYDAACRVISNLVRERDSARDEIMNMKLQVEDLEEEEDFVGDEYENMGIYQDLVDRMTENFFELSMQRKKRVIPEVADIEKFSMKYTSTPLNNRIVCSDLHKNNRYILLGYENGNCYFGEFNNNAFNTLNKNELHKKQVNDIQFYPSDSILGYTLCSNDTTASFLIRASIDEEIKFVERYRTQNHTQAVTSVSHHPLGEYLLLSSLDGSWSFHNVLKVRIKFNK